jgi:hypothetical protein
VIARLPAPTGSVLLSATACGASESDPAVGWARTFAVRTTVGVAPVSERVAAPTGTVRLSAGDCAVMASEPAPGCAKTFAVRTATGVAAVNERLRVAGEVWPVRLATAPLARANPCSDEPGHSQSGWQQALPG